MVILGEKEVQQGVVQLKDMTRHTQEVKYTQQDKQDIIANPLFYVSWLLCDRCTDVFYLSFASHTVCR